MGGGILTTLATDGECSNACDTDCYKCLYFEWDDELKEYTERVCKEYGVSHSIVLGIIWNESRFNSNATNLNSNGTTDYGLMQLNDVTFDFLSETIGLKSMDELYDAKTNILAGVNILSHYKEDTNNDLIALIKYQVGEGGYQSMLQTGSEPNKAFYSVVNKSNLFDKIISNNEMNGVINIINEIDNAILNIIKEIVL